MRLSSMRKSKNLLCKVIVSSACIFSVSATTCPVPTTLAATEEIVFSDVSKELYAYDAIYWAKEKGIISGYTDSNGQANGKFGPNDKVTEAQFVKMLAIFFRLKDNQGNVTKTTGGPHWSDTYYDALAKHSVPLKGYFNSTERMTAMQRGTVAQAIGYLLGNYQTLEQSIEFMLEKGITQGQNPQFEQSDLKQFFGSDNELTRAQAVTFLHRLHTKQFTQLADEVTEVGANTLVSLDAKVANPSTKEDSKYANFFGQVDENIDKVKETKQPEQHISFFDSLDSIQQPESTPLSQHISSQLGENKLGFEFVGYDDYSVRAEVNGKKVFGITYNKKVPVELQDAGDISISFIKGNAFYQLENYEHNVKNLFQYAGLSQQEADTVMKEFKIMYEKDKATLKDSINDKGYYIEYKFLLNRKLVISYEHDIILIIFSHEGEVFPE